MRDRVPTKVLPNGAIRFGEYDESGNLLGYKYIRREDEPTEAGTPNNKANLMPDALATKQGLNPVTATVADGIETAFEEVPIGDIKTSIRDDFAEKLTSGKYLPCDGRAVNAANYPDLAQAATPSVGYLWAQNTGYGANVALQMIVTNTGRWFVRSTDPTYRYSDNNGASWTSGTWSGNQTYIAKLANNRIWAPYFRSDDNGNTWVSHTWTPYLLARNGNKLFAASASGASSTILVSTDNGTTLVSKAVGASQSWMRGVVTNTGRIIIADGTAAMTTARYSDDDGNTWNALNPTTDASQPSGFFAAPSGLLVGLFSNGIYHSTDNGITWTKVNTSNVKPANQLYSSYVFGISASKIVRISNFGAGETATVTDVSAPYEIYADDTNGVFACSSSYGVWKALEAIKLPTISNFHVKVVN